MEEPPGERAELEAARLAGEREHPASAARPVTRPGDHVRLTTGDEIRNTTFMNPGGFSNETARGYDASAVDNLLGRVAAELDAGRPAGPLIEKARFHAWGKRLYDIDAVDWFLDQLLLHGRRPELDGTSGDPWRDLGVVAQFPRGGGRYGFDEKCNNEWHEFGQQPGTHLRLRWARVASSRRELCTAEQQPLASSKEFGQSGTVSIGERSFPFNTAGHAGSSSPDIAEIAARSSRDYAGHFAAQPISGRAQVEASGRKLSIAQRLADGISTAPLRLGYADEAGMPILYTSGVNYRGRACACISFPDQRCLRFFVRGTRKSNAIMTAVDQDGNKVARYRITGLGYMLRRENLEITVHPDWDLTDELVLAITISARWLSPYFDRPSVGGG